MKQFIKEIKDNWKQVTLAALVAVPLFVFFAYKLTSLTPGVSGSELNIIQNVLDQHVSLLDAFRNALWLPYNAILFGLQYVADTNNVIALLRGVGVVFAILSVLGMFKVLRYQHSLIVAILGTISFATSTSLLIVSRVISPEILYLLPIIVLSLWVDCYKERNNATTLAIALLIPLLLYIPGMVWLLLALAIVSNRTISRTIRYVSPGYVMSLFGIAAVLISPLVLSLVWPAEGTSALSILRNIGGLPEVFPEWSSLATNALELIRNLFFIGSGEAMHFVGNAPLVSFFVGITFFIGVIDSIHKISLDRSKLLLSWLLVGSVLVILGGVTIAFLIIPVFLASAYGIRYFFDEWFRVFPKNPLAKTVGLSLASIVLAISVVYQFMSYYIAWPKTQSVKNTFNQSIEEKKN